nr:carbon catabolite repressor protein 4 homolog 6 [Tanacetum cinerariifolium]
MLKNNRHLLPTATAMSHRPSPSHTGYRNRPYNTTTRPYNDVINNTNDVTPNNNFNNQYQSYSPRGHQPPRYVNPYQQFAPPPFYYQNQQFRPPTVYNNNLGPRQQNVDQFRPRGQSPQQFRPQQGFRQQRVLDYRNWEKAKPEPPASCERFTVLSYNILADYLAINHRSKLYFHIPRHILDWEFRKRSIMFELGLWSADILCFQEVDRFQDFEEELKIQGYTGIWKMRTGEPLDGCAIFWRSSRFKLLHEEAIEFNKFGLRDNVAQICVLESVLKKSSTASPLPACSEGHNKVVICNIHVLFNPKRGEIKLGQVRMLLDRAYATSKLWDDAPVVLCGDFNSTPKSSLYNFILDQKIDVSELPRDKISGQHSAEIRPKRAFTSTFRPQPTDNATQSPGRVDNKEVQHEAGSISSISSQPSTDMTHENAKTVENCTSEVLENISNAVADDNRVSNDDNILVDETVVTTSADELLEAIDGLSIGEDSTSFLSDLHGPDAADLVDDNGTSEAEISVGTSEVLNGSSITGSEPYIERPFYDPSGWTPMEIEAATGSSECTTMEHFLKLRSTYTEVEDYSGTRDSYGEPQVTSYHRAFQGTVDYIWRSEGLQTVRVLAPIPKQAMEWTPGFPTKRWGSDHVALVAELAFNKDVDNKNFEAR